MLSNISPAQRPSRVVAPVTAYDAHIVERLLAALTDDEKDAIYNWTLLADATHLPKLKEIARKVRRIQPIKVRTLTVYRGVGLDLSFQDHLGMFERRWFGYTLKSDLTVGSEFTYTNKRPLSFSTDITIARAFGRYVVQSTFVLNALDYLYFTPELSVVRCILANQKKYETQEEFVLLTTDKPQAYTLIEV